LLFTSIACGGAEPVAHTAAPQASVTAATAAKEPVLVEHPTTRAQWSVATDWAWKHSNAKAEYVALAYPIDGGAAGLLVDGDRAIATTSELKKVGTGETLSDLCVAKNGRFTAATKPGTRRTELFTADRFDGPLAKVGEYLHSVVIDDRRIWLVTTEKGTSLVDCASGATERVAGPMHSGFVYHWSPNVRVLLLHAGETVETGSCLVRVGASTTWTKEAECAVDERGDGSVMINTYDARRARKCAYGFDAAGKKISCDVPAGARRPDPVKLSLPNARFYAPSKLVTTAGPDNALYRTTASGAFDPSAAVDATKHACAPLLPTMPLFACLADDTHVSVLRIEADGSAREELRRTRPRVEKNAWRPEDQIGEWYVSWDGGVAVAGDCNGAPGNVACVRSADGKWRSVSFSEPLVKALSRTAPGTRLVPRADGRLFVGTATTDDILGGMPKVVLYDAQGGAGTNVEKLPMWILGALGRGAEHTTFGWSTSTHVRAWPLEREHPAFHTHEFCRVDLDLDGHFDADCSQGQIFSAGRVGLWEKQPGEVYETLDAAQTWTPVAIPKGLPTNDIECEAAGCRIGPYFRLGWGG
jgi:hypothetical protein